MPSEATKISDIDKDALLGRVSSMALSFYETYTPLTRHGKGWRGPCPLHGGDGPNFVVYPEGNWYCWTGCGEGGDALDFLVRQEGLDFKAALERLNDWAGGSFRTLPNARPSPPRPKPAPEPSALLDAELAHAAHLRLIGCEPWLRYLARHRGWTPESIACFGIGLDTREEVCFGQGGVVLRKEGITRVTFPVYDLAGNLTNLRRHLFPHAAGLTPEVRASFGKAKGWQPGLASDLFPLPAIGPADGTGEPYVLLVEGEADAVLANQMGFPCVTGTLGAGGWHARGTDALRGRERITILYDADAAGALGAWKRARDLVPICPDVRVALLPQGRDGTAKVGNTKDLTDFVVKEGGSPSALRECLRRAIPAPRLLRDLPMPERAAHEERTAFSLSILAYLGELGFDEIRRFYKCDKIY